MEGGGEREEHGNWDLRHSLGAHGFENTRDMLKTQRCWHAEALNTKMIAFMP